jgi:succinate dehydrogenase / fumarate reductase flavoprotein subunit
MAVGEGACVSVHGANRLGTNSLLDIVVFGRAAALRAAELIKPGKTHSSLPEVITERIIKEFDSVRNQKGDIKVGELRQELQKTMQSHCSVFRTQEVLDNGIHQMQNIIKSYKNLSLSDNSLIWNTELMEALELKNLIQQSIVTLSSAAARHESRGGHARDDFPDRDDKHWMKHTLSWFDDKKNRVNLGYRPVHMYTLTDEVKVIPPKPRVY